MSDYITCNSEIFNFWFGLVNLIVVIVGADWAFYIYYKHRDNVRWEKNIDYGHDGMKCLKKFHLTIADLFGQSFDSDKKIDYSLEQVKLIETYGIDPRVKEIYQHAKTFEFKKAYHQNVITNALTDIICIGLKSKNKQLVLESHKFEEAVTEIFELNRDISETCKAYVLGKFENPEKIYKLNKKFPKHYNDKDSLLKDVLDISTRLEVLFTLLMDDENFIIKTNLDIYEIAKGNVAIGVVNDAKAYKINRNIEAMVATSMELLLQQGNNLIGYNLSPTDERRLLAEVKKEFKSWLKLNP